MTAVVEPSVVAAFAFPFPFPFPFAFTAVAAVIAVAAVPSRVIVQRVEYPPQVEVSRRGRWVS